MISAKNGNGVPAAGNSNTRNEVLQMPNQHQMNGNSHQQRYQKANGAAHYKQHHHHRHQAPVSTDNSHIGRNLSIVSKAQIRYTGVLSAVDYENYTLTMSTVRSHGTEDRLAQDFIPPSQTIYPRIEFDAVNIQDLFEDQGEDILQSDPAIVNVQQSPKNHSHLQKAFSNFTDNVSDNTSEQVTHLREKRARSNNNRRQTQNQPKAFTNQKQSKGNRVPLNAGASSSAATKKLENKLGSKLKISTQIAAAAKDSKPVDLSKVLVIEENKENAENDKFFVESGFFDNLSTKTPARSATSKIDFKKDNVETFGEDYFNLARSASASRYNNGNKRRYSNYRSANYRNRRRNNNKNAAGTDGDKADKTKTTSTAEKKDQAETVLQKAAAVTDSVSDMPPKDVEAQQNGAEDSAKTATVAQS